MWQAKSSAGRKGGRTSLFKRLQKNLKKAQFINKHPELENATYELNEAARFNSINRREFLNLAAKAGLISSVSAVPYKGIFALSEPAPLGKVAGAPVAILGGGLAGMTAAYRLMKAGVSCEIFEGQHRVGGRVLTHTDFYNGMFVEMGAEFIDSVHEDLLELCKELGVETENLTKDDKGVLDVFYFFDGKYYTDQDLIKAFRPLAKKIGEDYDKAFPDEDYVNFSEAAKKFDKMSIAEYLEVVGKDIDPWVIKMLHVAYNNEYGLAPSEQSALNLITYIDVDMSDGLKLFEDSDEGTRVKGGNTGIAKALYQVLHNKVKFNFGYKLIKIAQAGNSEIEMTFKTHKGVTKVRKFGQVVCALPFSTLRDVEGVDSLEMNPVKKRSIKEYGYGTNAKLMLAFDRKYWRQKELRFPSSNGSLYTGLKSQEYWETSRGQEKEGGILTNYLGGRLGRDFMNSYQANLQTSLNDLERIFPGVNKHYADKATMMPWPLLNWAKGSYACTKVGQYTTIKNVAGNSELKGRLLFAGEHTSTDSNGFMNGAVETGNLAAAAVIKSRKPKEQRRVTSELRTNP